MSLINTNGLVLIGPGSEWLWAAVSGIVTAVTLIAIFRQLRLQRNEAAVAQVDALGRELTSERFLLHKLSIWEALRDGVEPDAIPAGAAQALANYWDGLGTLVREGHFTRRLVVETAGIICQEWWIILAPVIRSWRTHWNNPGIYETFEWLARTTREADLEAHWSTLAEDEAAGAAYVGRSLDGWISRAREQLRVEQLLRTVIVAPPAPELERKPAVTAATKRPSRAPTSRDIQQR